MTSTERQQTNDTLSLTTAHRVVEAMSISVARPSCSGTSELFSDTNLSWVCTSRLYSVSSLSSEGSKLGFICSNMTFEWINETISRSNKEPSRPNKELGGSNKRLAGSNKELVGTYKELAGSNTELAGLNKRFAGSNKRLAGSNKRLVNTIREQNISTLAFFTLCFGVFKSPFRFSPIVSSKIKITVVLFTPNYNYLDKVDRAYLTINIYKQFKI